MEILNFELIKFSNKTEQEFLSIIIFFAFNLIKKSSIWFSLKKNVLLKSLFLRILEQLLISEKKLISPLIFNIALHLGIGLKGLSLPLNI